MRLVFNDEALGDIGHIHRWIAVDSPVAAARMIERISASLETLALFYEVSYAADEVFVLAIFHQAQDR